MSPAIELTKEGRSLESTLLSIYIWGDDSAVEDMIRHIDVGDQDKVVVPVVGTVGYVEQILRGADPEGVGGSPRTPGIPG